ncbi:MAG: FecR family protein [Mariniphaga sp.]|nr:FecR family protein [Mariniphaga sp.]
MDYQIVNKYLRGETSETEVAEVFKWIEAAPENRKEFISYKKVWALTAKGNENESHAWRFLFVPRFKKQKLFKTYLKIAKYAAILLIVFGAGIALQYIGLGIDKEKLVYQKCTSIVAPLGQMTNVELPDGTKVMLNSGSSLTYNGNFSRGERFVSLNGEAYFDVTKDQEHPFVVQTSLLNFKVHGTSFNIEAYTDENLVNTTLIEGSLGVMNKSNQELLLLEPGQNAHFNSLHPNVIVSNVNTEIYTSWKEGLITFRNEKLKDIARKIERWYNVKIVIKNPKLGEEAYFGTIMKNKPIDQILVVLQLTSSLKYKITASPDKPTLIYWY